MTEESGVAPLAEMEHSSEILAQDLVARVDRGLHELGVPPREARDWGWCNFVPDAVNYCAVQDSREKGYEVRVAKYQARDLHLAATGKPTVKEILPPGWDWSEPPGSEADVAVRARISAYYADPEVEGVMETTFGHGFNVIDINHEPFLVDLSFSQFVGSDGMLARGADNLSSGIPTDHPLAQQLLHDGFIPLNNESLRTYMRFLCTHQPEYLGNVTVDLLDRVNPLPFEVDDNELLGKIPPAYSSQ